MGNIITSTDRLDTWPPPFRNAAGIARPLDDLVEMWPRAILQMTTEQQAEYADAVCRESAPDRAFSEEQMIAIREAFPSGAPNNTTGVANMAYMALHAHPDFRDEYQIVLMAYSMALKRRYGLSST